jgi:hypothetical protein
LEHVEIKFAVFLCNSGNAGTTITNLLKNCSTLE